MAAKLTITTYGDDGVVTSCETLERISGRIASLLKSVPGATIELCKQPPKRRIEQSRQEDDARVILDKLQVEPPQKKIKISCPFHQDRTPSAELTKYMGFKCFSSNCKYANVYMPRAKFAKLLKEL